MGFSDLFHNYGSDLVLSPTGNISATSGATLTAQTVVRFILTNPGDDPFNPTFGLGAAQMIGEPNAVAKTQALILQGLKTLSIIDQTQPISATVSLDDLGELNANISYTDAATGLNVAQPFQIV